MAPTPTPHSAPHSGRERREEARRERKTEIKKHSSSKLQPELRRVCPGSYFHLRANALQHHFLLTDSLPSAPDSHPPYRPLLVISSPQLPFLPSSPHRQTSSPSPSCKTLCLHPLPRPTLIFQPDLTFPLHKSHFCPHALPKYNSLGQPQPLTHSLLILSLLYASSCLT